MISLTFSAQSTTSHSDDSPCVSVPPPPWSMHKVMLKGVPRWCDRFGQYGIKVSFWASGTLKIVIYVENYPQKRCFRLTDYHPL